MTVVVTWLDWSTGPQGVLGDIVNQSGHHGQFDYTNHALSAGSSDSNTQELIGVPCQSQANDAILLSRRLQIQATCDSCAN